MRLNQQHRGARPQFDGGRRRNENNYNERGENNYYERRGEQGRRGYNDPNRMNEETFGSTAVREQREQYNKGRESFGVMGIEENFICKSFGYSVYLGRQYISRKSCGKVTGQSPSVYTRKFFGHGKKSNDR